MHMRHGCASSGGWLVGDVDWDRTVFMLLCPDALARHRGSAILGALAAAGFEPSGWRVLWFRPHDLDSFHERNIASAWEVYRYRLVDQLFAFGPAVALAMTDVRPQDGQDSHSRLRLAKGPSDPARSGPDTIRGAFKSVNAMLALMHSSDSPADSVRESAVFSGPDGLAGGDLDDLATTLGLLEASRPREDRDYLDVVAGVRARSLAAAWPELSRPVRKTASAMLEAGLAELAAPGSGERLAGLLPAAHPLADLLRADFTPGSAGPDPDRVAVTLAAYGTGIDEWERLVLATSRRFWPRQVLLARRA
jgi:nucleoside diphosphate kinase